MQVILFNFVSDIVLKKIDILSIAIETGGAEQISWFQQLFDICAYKAHHWRLFESSLPLFVLYII